MGLQAFLWLKVFASSLQALVRLVFAIKPLYYYYDGARFAFASELKALEQALPPRELEVDPQRLLRLPGLPVCARAENALQALLQAAAGARARVLPRHGRFAVAAALLELAHAGRAAQPPLEAACEELRSLIGASVAEQMVADVPLGFFLSGGVDSSVVVAAAAATGTRVATFSIGFDADEVSETPFAREVAQRFGTDHHERILSQAHAQELLPRLKSWFDEPFADESSMPTYLVCSAAREHVTVVLDGRRRRRGLRRLSDLSALRALLALADLAGRHREPRPTRCAGRFRAAMPSHAR